MLLKIHLLNICEKWNQSYNFHISSQFGRAINNISRFVLLVFMISLSQNSPLINLPYINSWLTGNLIYLLDISMQFI